MQYIRCFYDKTFLSDKRSEVTWKAVTKLAIRFLPHELFIAQGWPKPHIAQPNEPTVWREAFEKIKETTVQPLPFKLADYMTPLGNIDVERIADNQKIPVEEASMMIKMNDRMLMVRAAGEILFALTHSRDKDHTVGLYRPR